jgi:hypothetical protein
MMRHFRRPETLNQFEANSIPVFLLLAIGKENKRTATFALERWRTTSTAMTTPFLAGLVWPYLEVAAEALDVLLVSLKRLGVVSLL